MQNTLNEVKSTDTYIDEDISSLVSYIINIYIAKYPISGYINNNPNLHLANLEKFLNKKQLEIIKYPYHSEKPISLIINPNSINKITINIMVNPTNGIVDKESINLLNKLYKNIEENLTVEELLAIIQNNNIVNTDTSNIEYFIIRCQENIVLRSKIIEYIKNALDISDMNIASNGIYRRNMFIREFYNYYGIVDNNKKLVRSKKNNN